MLERSKKVVSKLLCPDDEFLEFLVVKSWRYQVIWAIVQAAYLGLSVYQVFALGYSTLPFFCILISFTFRVLTLTCGLCASSTFYLRASTACFAVETICQIMPNTDVQKVMWLSVYGHLPGNPGPCFQCFPDMVGSWIFGLTLSYMLLFILPFRNAVFVLSPCTAAFVSCLVYSRFQMDKSFGLTLSEADLLDQTAWTVRTTLHEITLLAAMIAINVTAKVAMETSESELWQALKRAQESVLCEKILRCKAEYSLDCEHVKMEVKEDDAPSSYRDSTSGGFHPRAPLSAPPILDREYEGLMESACLRGSDCLREGDTVWASEVQHPIPVEQLLEGQHVLCYDHLSKGLKHAQVLNVSVQKDTTQWVTITLKDGTSLKVTADHPLLTDECENGMQKAPVRAAELKPHCDKLFVMKMVPVDVQSVDLDSPKELREQNRISIDIQQPFRHSIFVTRSDQCGHQDAMAVGASNLDVLAPEYFARANNTFLDVDTEKPILRRTNSSPGCLETTLPSKKATFVRNPDKSSSAKSSSVPSSVSSVSTPDDGDTCKVRIGTTLRPVLNGAGQVIQVFASPSADAEHVAGLQDYLQVQRAGMPSIGSFSHKEGACSSVCWFENQRQHGRPKRCTAGASCERCHFDHAYLKRKRVAKAT